MVASQAPPDPPGPEAARETRRPRQPRHVANVLVLSPHLDDAVFSAGGLVHDAARRGRLAVVVTVCAGEPADGPLSALAASLHARWGAAEDAGRQIVARRRAEDVLAMRVLGAEGLWLDEVDCIYRRDPVTGAWLYPDEAALFGPLHPADADRADHLAARLGALTCVGAGTHVVAPLAAGNHVDHQLVRIAAETAFTSRKRMGYYEDFPYVDSDAALGRALGETARWRKRRVWLDTRDVEAKVTAIAAYASQRSSFWASDDAMAEAVRAHAARRSGVGGLAERLWYPRPQT